MFKNWRNNWQSVPAVQPRNTQCNVIFVTSLIKLLFLHYNTNIWSEENALSTSGTIYLQGLSFSHRICESLKSYMVRKTVSCVSKDTSTHLQFQTVKEVYKTALTFETNLLLSIDTSVTLYPQTKCNIPKHLNLQDFTSSSVQLDSLLQQTTFWWQNCRMSLSKTRSSPTS